MKKLYVLTVVCLAFVFATSAQTTYYWIGASGGNWSQSSNWSLSSHGSASAGFPNSTSANVVFDTSINVTLNQSVDLNTLSVINGKSVKITSTGDTRLLTLNSTSAATPGLKIDAGCKLESDASPNSENVTTFVANGQASISGEWLLSGNIDQNGNAYFDLGEQGAATRVNVNGGGQITVGQNGFMAPNDAVGDDYLVFESGSTLEFQGDYVQVPSANYDAASTILVDGLLTNGVLIMETGSIGNLTFNCPSLSNASNLDLYDITVKGNLLVQNTNFQQLNLISISGISNPSVDVIINGDFTISGNSAVVESDVFDNKTTNLTVKGNFTAGGVSFDLQSDDEATLPTNLIVQGNFLHTAGSFGASSAAANENLDLFNVEMNGGAGQTFSSTTGTIDNAKNQVALRINNAAGVTLLNSLAVGRVDFNTTNKGVIKTGANVLTIDNTSGNANVINGYGSNAFVDGSLAMTTTSTSETVFPSGTGGVLRPIGITPSMSTPNKFVVNLLSGDNGVSPLSPIARLANYYWNVSRSSGTGTAIIRMDLQNAIPGASATDTLVAVAFDGSNWHDARGTTNAYIFPGNQSSGTLLTKPQSAFQAYTIGIIVDATLPIKLLSFTGKKVQSTAELNWEITENSTPAKFEVVRSVDGVSFTSIGVLPGLEGKLKYSLTDNSLAPGNNFYRLKMYDKDGTVSYSNIIVVMNGSKGVVVSAMMPTVVKDRSRLSVTSSVKGTMQLVVTDISGRIVLNQIASIDAGNQDVWLNASSLSAGMFQVTGYINGEKTTTFRFIKQ